MNETITAVPGVRVGHWTSDVEMTGCTVVILPEPNVVALEVRGGAPGSRETALLAPGMRVLQAQAILLTGGSAFGLAAADGVVRALSEDGRGHDTGVFRVPIVPAAVLFDLMPGSSVRPGPDEGEAAYRAAGDDPVPTGLIGAGRGATVAKWRGFEHMRPGGIGSATRMVDGVTVGALAAVNAVGDVFTIGGEPLTGGEHEPGAPGLIPRAENTTLAVIATDALLDRNELGRLAVRAQDAFSVCLRPAHTRFDGDIVFAVSCGEKVADVESVAEAAFAATAAAIENAILTSTV